MRRIALGLLVVAVVLMGRTAAARLGFGAGYAPPALAASYSELSAAPDGARTWFGEPMQVRHGDYVYIGYVDTSGNVALRVRDLVAATTGPEIVLHPALDVDDHVNPSFLVRPDGRLQAFYARHEPLSTDMHTRVSVNTLASDPTLSGGFATEVNLDAALGARSYDYPFPIYLSAEGTIYLFWRNIPSGSNYDLWYATSSDGDTWSAGTKLFGDTYAYWKMATNGVDRIDFAVSDHSPNIGTTKLAHFYYQSGTWRGSAGASLGTPPFTFAGLTLVYDATNSWVWDINYVGGNPVILFPAWPGSFSDTRYRYASWNGSAWSSLEICAAGGGIDSTGVYSGGIAFDKIDANIVYASRQVSGQWEVYRYTKSGASFSEQAITSGSPSKNIRPSGVWNADSRLRVVWMVGAYSGYTSFNTGLRGAP